MYFFISINFIFVSLLAKSLKHCSLAYSIVQLSLYSHLGVRALNDALGWIWGKSIAKHAHTKEQDLNSI